MGIHPRKIWQLSARGYWLSLFTVHRSPFTEE